MKYFTKKYIAKCNCKEIQKLRPQLKVGDLKIAEGLKKRLMDLLIERI
ncbi:MAG: hypothetical protein ACTSPI_00880 [Candidatus Heimdallarchaeaceae archaeon]